MYSLAKINKRKESLFVVYFALFVVHHFFKLFERRFQIEAKFVGFNLSSWENRKKAYIAPQFQISITLFLKSGIDYLQNHKLCFNVTKFIHYVFTDPLEIKTGSMF